MTIIDEKCFLKREDGSDKIYWIQLEQQGPNSFMVPFRYGRRERGFSGLTRAWKTDGKDSKVPVLLNEEDARKVFDSTVRTREKHGYQTFNNWDELNTFNAIAYE